MPAMSRVILATLALLALPACVKVRVASQDFTAGTFVICGNRHAEPNDINAKAREVCPAGPKILRCAEEVSGTVGYARVYSTQHSARAVALSEPLRDNCCEFQCPPQ